MDAGITEVAMTDDDVDADEIRAEENDRSTATDAVDVDWKTMPIDPDLGRYFGYELEQWEKIPVADDPDQVIFLPGNEEDIAEDAFVVSDSDTLCDLVTRR